MFKAKVRQVGTSLGLLLPKDVVDEENLKAGSEVDVSLFRPRKELIEKYFGIDKGAKPFVREHDHRD